MLLEDDLDLATQYYRLRGQHIYYRHVLDNYRRYGALAPVLAQLSPLCNGFVHDLGNGLNAIRSKLERLSAEPNIPTHAQAIARAKALCTGCGWRLYALQEVSPSPPLHPEPVNLPEWIPRILETLTAWQLPSVQVEFHTLESRLIVADYDNMLRLALLEPLLNAFQALPDGGQVSVFLQRLDDGVAKIEITDTGPGLPPGDPEQCSNLRFTTGPHCYGLGLYVARKVVEKHRGTLTLLSEPGQGARVIIQLPVGNPEPDWDDESALVRELESLHDTLASQKQEIETYRATYDLSREQMLTQLSDLFGQLSVSIIQFLETGIAGIRRLLTPLSSQTTKEATDHIHFILERCGYCDILLGEARALDPDLDIKLAPTDLNQIASQIVQLMTWRAQRGTQLHLTQATSLPLVQADASLIATALLNLLRNALDAAGQDGRVDVQTLSSDDAVIIRFMNTGDTIPLDARSRIFDLDYTTRHGRTFGLGLHVARVIITRHNGFIAMRDMQQFQTVLELVLFRVGGTMIANVIANLKDSNSKTRQSAIQALVQIGKPAVEPLIAVLEDADSGVRQAAARALGQIGDTRAVEPLIAVLKDGDKRVRRDVVEALKCFDTPQATTALKKYGKWVVVCIEDDPDMIVLIKACLEREGFDIVGAIGGRKGLETVRRLKPDLVLLDLTMPEIDGLEVYQQMKADDELKDIPVIIVTAKTRHIDKFLLKEIAMADDYVTKPFYPHKLLQSVNKVLKLDTVGDRPGDFSDGCLLES